MDFFKIIIFAVGLLVGAIGIVLMRNGKACCKRMSYVFKARYFPEYRYPYSLPPLEYAYDALEPHFDAQTMQIHHTKHHQAYVDNLNKALEAFPECQSMVLEELLVNLDKQPVELRQKLQDHGGGHFNHTFFWKLLTPGATGEPVGKSAQAITQFFGSLDAFKGKFDDAAKTRFGSGWAWLCMDQGKHLVIVSTGNQDTPFGQGLFPIIGLDVWEHAYYLKFQNKRVDYIGSWWKVINWKQVEANYQTALKAFGE